MSHILDTTEPYLFTSESVTEGHPDKVADQISDAVLDAHLAGDPASRVACETLVAPGRVVLAGEITSKAAVDRDAVVREVVRRIGYDRPADGFAADTLVVDEHVIAQAPEISAGVDRGGAGDQGLMFGFACDETAELMPLPITLAHDLTRGLTELRRSGRLPWLRPDGKSQVTVRYRRGRAEAVTAVVVSTQHEASVRTPEVHAALLEHLIRPTLAARGLGASDPKIHVNPSGSFVTGGPAADSGLTGRKIIVDTYGGAAPHGGGAFSGKDATKVDRSAAYMARHVAKAVVAAGLAGRALVQLAYAIGVAEPVSVLVHTFGTARVPERRLADAVAEVFPLTPRGMIEALGLERPVFQATAASGHFGRDGFAWEDVAAPAAALRRRVGEVA